MALFPALLFLAAVLLPFFPANGQKPGFAAMATGRREVQSEIVNKHNEVRRSVSPPARNMLKMQWDSKAAANAQRWANKCVLKHSSSEDRKVANACEYDDMYSNCKDLKSQLSCGNDFVKTNCKAACNCSKKIY
ncbi:Cysteine-rich secretory protein 3 [Myotis brandtii]|uniref:Cysteine-rich secretory protein 3 n=1 Tax=Myotis brandtii TaxID=109478 RepID=S7MNP5_MYOBR|nr:Cysteine-rich secretory protein 3 [Myotis brandtii]